MDAYFPIFGSNGPLWSLKYEWWFYMLYPILFYLSRKNILQSTILCIALFFLAKFTTLISDFILGFQISSMLLCWWIGAILAEIVIGRVQIPLKFVSFLSLFLLFILFPKSWPLRDLLISLGFVGIFASLFTLQENGFSLLYLEKLKPLGDFSYTLYIIHAPFLYFASGLLMWWYGGDILPIHFGYVLLFSVIVVIISYFIHFISERPFLSVKSNLK